MQRGKKVTARKSTGGKAPRKQLVTMAERKEEETSGAESARESSSSSSEDESSEEERSVELIPPEYQVPQGQCPECGSVGILGWACETCQNKRNNYDPIPSSDEEKAG